MADSADQINEFMAAIRQKESGGNYTVVNRDSGAYGAYQFLKGTFVGAAKLAGVSTAWPPSKEAQDAAARALMLQYFGKTKQWGMVARFWYAGPGSIKYSDAALNRKQGGGKYPSINDYSNAILSAMGSADMSGLGGGAGAGGTTGSPASPEAIEETVRLEYPEYAWLLDNPEVRDILLEAVDPERGMDDATFQSRIRQTQWWQTNGSAARQWESLRQTDPAQAARALATRKAELRSRATQLGVTASEMEIEQLADRSIRYNLTDSEMNVAFAELMAGDAPAGATASTMTQLKSAARQFMVNVTDDELVRWARGIVTGQTTIDDYQKSLQELAKAKFSGNEQLTAMIDSGMSPANFFADHVNMIASEWDLSPTQVDLLDTKWQGVLQTADGGKVRPMTLSETRKQVRSMSGWDKTSQGRKMVADNVTTLLEKFGKVAY
jgi:hypothetical protein